MHWQVWAAPSCEYARVQMHPRLRFTLSATKREDKKAADAKREIDRAIKRR